MQYVRNLWYRDGLKQGFLEKAPRCNPGTLIILSPTHTASGSTDVHWTCVDEASETFTVSVDGTPVATGQTSPATVDFTSYAGTTVTLEVQSEQNMVVNDTVRGVTVSASADLFYFRASSAPYGFYSAKTDDVSSPETIRSEASSFTVGRSACGTTKTYTMLSTTSIGVWNHDGSASETISGAGGGYLIRDIVADDDYLYVFADNASSVAVCRRYSAADNSYVDSLSLYDTNFSRRIRAACTDGEYLYAAVEQGSSSRNRNWKKIRISDFTLVYSSANYTNYPNNRYCKGATCDIENSEIHVNIYLEGGYKCAISSLTGTLTSTGYNQSYFDMFWKNSKMYATNNGSGFYELNTGGGATEILSGNYSGASVKDEGIS